MVLRTRSDTAKEIKILVLRHNLAGFQKSARACVQWRLAAEHDRGGIALPALPDLQLAGELADAACSRIPSARRARPRAGARARRAPRQPGTVAIGQLHVKQHNVGHDAPAALRALAPSAASPTTSNPSATSSRRANVRNDVWSSRSAPPRARRRYCPRRAWPMASSPRGRSKRCGLGRCGCRVRSIFGTLGRPHDPGDHQQPR